MKGPKKKKKGREGADSMGKGPALSRPAGERGRGSICPEKGCQLQAHPLQWPHPQKPPLQWGERGANPLKMGTPGGSPPMWRKAGSATNRETAQLRA